MTNKKILIFAILINALALIALLVYSIERTAWLFDLFEDWTPAARAAAVVVELAAVALLVGAGAIAQLDREARAWANRALVAVLSVQALANLTAGYLRGGRETLGLFQGDPWASYAVAAALWLSVNLAVPGLILCLSKLMERLLFAQQNATKKSADISELRALLSATTADLAHAREAHAQLQAATARPDPLLAQQASELAHNEEILAQYQNELARRETLLAQARQESAQRDRAYSEELRTKERELAQLRSELAQVCAGGEVDRVVVARRLRNAGVSSRETAELLRIPESTLRNRLKVGEE